MKTYKTFRNVNQVINEVSYIAFQVAEISESCLVISDSKIDAELLRNSTPAQRAAGMTIFIREHGTQFAHAEDVAEVRAAWGPQIVRTIEISKERGGLWVVALDCATRYDRNGEPVETTTQSKKITAAQAREVATMAMRCAVLTQSATDIKAAELARCEADRLEEIATRAEVADEMAQRRAELEALEAEQTNEDENEPQDGEQTTTEDNTPTEAENEPQSERKAHAVAFIKKTADKVAHGAKVATSKAVALAAVVLCLAVGIGAMVGSMYVCGQVGEACEASGVVLPAALRIVLSVAFLFTFVLDFSCWAELQIMRIFEKCHAFAGFGGIYYRGEENGVFVRPFSVIGRLVHEMRTA